MKPPKNGFLLILSSQIQFQSRPNLNLPSMTPETISPMSLPSKMMVLRSTLPEDMQKHSMLRHEKHVWKQLKMERSGGEGL